MKIERSNIDEIFKALDAQIGVHGGIAINLVICGDTALAALELVSRTTKDADILGIMEMAQSKPFIFAIKKMPDWLKRAAEVVGRDFGLPDNWLNIGPMSQLESGLPEGFVERLVIRKYGRYLSVYYIGRIDQIHFKLYAAVDRNDYHTQDLLALKPSVQEMKTAAQWVLTQDVSETFRLLLRDFLERTGYAEITDII